jgi:curved DNA-binding protein CbpA
MASSKSSKPRETGLYEKLGVQPDADLLKIKRAYRAKAREVHPDKNPDGTEAFKELAEAVNILEHHREVYNAEGYDAAKRIARKPDLEDAKQIFKFTDGLKDDEMTGPLGEVNKQTDRLLSFWARADPNNSTIAELFGVGPNGSYFDIVDAYLEASRLMHPLTLEHKDTRAETARRGKHK